MCQVRFHGTLVGWAGVINTRSYRGTLNNTEPIAQFHYRGDLSLNAPYEMRKVKFLWQMVAP